MFLLNSLSLNLFVFGVTLDVDNVDDKVLLGTTVLLVLNSLEFIALTLEDVLVFLLTLEVTVVPTGPTPPLALFITLPLHDEAAEVVTGGGITVHVIEALEIGVCGNIPGVPGVPGVVGVNGIAGG